METQGKKIKDVGAIGKESITDSAKIPISTGGSTAQTVTIGTLREVVGGGYEPPAGGIPLADLSEEVRNAVGMAGEVTEIGEQVEALESAVSAKYEKPAGGIPLQDLSEEVQGAVRPFIGGGGSGGTTTEATTLILDDLRGSGEMVDYYLHYRQGIPTRYADCIITKPIYLHAGDEVSARTGGDGPTVFAKSPSGAIAYNTTGFTLISGTAKSYSGTVEEDGWYVFSGRINRTDGTNLVVSITKYTEVAGGSGLPIIEEINSRLDALESGQEAAGLVSGGCGYALSVGVNSIIADVPASPWFNEEITTGMTYGNYLDNKIDSVPDGESFIFIADCHWASNRKASPMLIDYVRRRLGIKTIIHGGDVLNESETKELAAKEWLNFNKAFVFRIGGDFKQVCGDHDHNGRYASTGQMLPYQFVQKVMNGYNLKELTVDTFYDEQIAQVAAANGWTEDEKKEYEAWKKMHYWFDDDTINTRFIVLHTGWTGEGGLISSKLGQWSESEAYALYLQMDFLYEALISCPAGMNVVVCGHNVIGNNSYSVSVGGSTAYRYNVNEPIYKGQWRDVAKMLAAFKNKEMVSVTYRDWGTGATAPKTFDFAEANTPNFVFCMGGDVHWDIIGKSSGTNQDLQPLAVASSVDNIIVTEGTVNRNEILHVLPMTDASDRGYKGIIAAPTDSYNDATDSVVICNPNTEGTLDSQAFDIVTMTKDALYLTRIGSGSDRVVRFVD